MGPSAGRGCCFETSRFELAIELSFWDGEVEEEVEGAHLLSQGEELEVGLDWVEVVGVELSSVTAVAEEEERRLEKGLRRG